MTDVIISNTTRASDAACWCLDNLESGSWRMDVLNFCTPAIRYRFSFSDSGAATFVSLKYV